MTDLESLIAKENKEEFERQLERLGFFTQNGFTSQATRINEIEAVLYGLINTLLKDGTINQEKLESISASVKEDIANKKEQFAGVSFNFDGSGEIPNQNNPVNCNERLHICKSICCRLDFALSPEEVEAGKIKWDLGIPYRIRQGSDGYCTHNRKEDRCCGIYNDRPKVCKIYSCAEDKRIWNDFEKMELNEEWIKNNIKAKKVEFVREPMIE